MKSLCLGYWSCFPPSVSCVYLICKALRVFSTSFKLVSMMKLQRHKRLKKIFVVLHLELEVIIYIFSNFNLEFYFYSKYTISSLKVSTYIDLVLKVCIYVDTLFNS